MAFQAIASCHDLAGRVGDDDLQSLRCGMDKDAIAGVIRVDPGTREGEARGAGARKPEVPGFKRTGHEEVVILFGSGRNDTRDNSRASLQEARRSRLESCLGADLLDEAVLRLEDDVLDVEGTRARLVHAVGELRIDGLNDLSEARLHFDGDFHHVALEQPFHLLERLVKRIAKRPARGFLAPQLVEPLILLVDHPERVPEHGLPLAHKRAPAHCAPSGVCRRRYFPFPREPWFAYLPLNVGLDDPIQHYM